MTLQVPLKYGLVAAVITEESDRVVYVPPPVAYGEHAATCGCPDCRLLRGLKGK